MAAKVEFISYSQIEAKVRALHREIWDRQVSLWPGEQLTPLQMLTPETAARIFGIDYRSEVSLGRFGSKDARFQPAGVLDRQGNFIAVSEQMPMKTRSFTGAHEFGHLDLHPGLVMHRDLPIAGLIVNGGYLPRVEKEANYYAACYLVPRKLLLKAFRPMFGTDCLRLNEATAFALARSDADDLMSSPVGSLDFALRASVAMSFNGKHFEPLIKLFNVSATTMAIRLQETGLVEA